MHLVAFQIPLDSGWEHLCQSPPCNSGQLPDMMKLHLALAHPSKLTLLHAVGMDLLSTSSMAR